MKKEISFADIKNSPYLIVTVLAIFVIGAIAASVYMTKDILGAKEAIASLNEEYVANCDKVAYLQTLQAQADQLQAEKDMFDEILPETSDVHQLVDEFNTTCRRFNLSVEVFGTPTVVVNAVTETEMTMTVKGTYDNIIAFTDYYANQTALHRVERLNISSVEGESAKTAEIIITVLSK